MDGDKYDVVVVGGGVIGLFCAYYNALQGKTVLVLEKDKVMKSCSYGNCGLVSPSHALPLNSPQQLIKAFKWLFQKDAPFFIHPQWNKDFIAWMFGFAKVSLSKKQIALSMNGRDALLKSSRNLYNAIFSQEDWHCNWSTSGIHFVYHNKKKFQAYAKNNEELSKIDLGAQPMVGEELYQSEPCLTDYAYGSWYYPMDASLNPGELLTSLLAQLKEMGVRIIENCGVKDWLTSKNIVQGVRVKENEFYGNNVVVATGSMSPKLVKDLKLGLSIIPGKGYSITMKSPEIKPKCPIIFDEHKVVATPWKDSYRLGGTMEFSGYDTSLNQRRIGNLKKVAARYLKEPYTNEQVSKWYGWRPMTPNGLPIIDKSPAYSNLYLACGHNMLGLSMAPATGKLISEMIEGQKGHINNLPYSIN
ncbi:MULTISPECIES: NAD(P)/FAD-dependent oxidoreductase [Flavobacteriaceae]|uniref:NAD(P)/FAD-dependent oxidoreductase n=1 Tax=Flavobacteriaceae TaxID=49546 RepID=UPI001490A896|nr:MULTISPECIES: FAD-dependent oxidoreductase [Allomuricauda]MDC6366818.1 FAD-dependent oxidoreductase [Muricauda sp. AC10]